MQVSCTKHGMQSMINISIDVLKEMENSNFIFNPIIIFYEFDDEISESFYVSEKHASKYNLKHNQTLALPDDYPDWVLNLKPICRACLKEHLSQEYFKQNTSSEWVI